ncbi:uncharacterized protein LOC128553563 [Mercenaria mercenaria]|uniref:uncharacterized protein LOC128553563 n=1 Tax=Mercenaria mercenaria TaxID=6596 RepID=UPI00234EB9FA|nr:uncharacterized protein LOC128553563 [Mercenaria mercenaria]
MYMDYSCIKRKKIGNMCSNGTFTPTDGPFYLYNTDYPSSMEATVGVCQCEIKSDSANIQFYSIDIRLEKYGNECKQTFNVTDSEGTVYWDCESAPIFNVTKLTKNQVVTITFRNNLPVDGGHVWIGFSGDSDDTLKIDCTHQLKEVTVQSTTPLHSTNSAQATDELTRTQGSTIEHESTSTEETTNRHEPVTTDSTSSFYETTIFTEPSPSITKTTVTAIATTRVHESTKETTNTDVSASTTVFQTTSTTKNMITDGKTGTREPITTTKGASSIPDPFATSTQNVIPTTQSLTEQLKIVIKEESRLFPIMLAILLIMVFCVIVVLVCWLIGRNRGERQISPGRDGQETVIDISDENANKRIGERTNNKNENTVASTAKVVSPTHSYLQVDGVPSEDDLSSIRHKATVTNDDGTVKNVQCVKSTQTDNNDNKTNEVVSPTNSYVHVWGASSENDFSSLRHGAALKHEDKTEQNSQYVEMTQTDNNDDRTSEDRSPTNIHLSASGSSIERAPSQIHRGPFKDEAKTEQSIPYTGSMYMENNDKNNTGRNLTSINTEGPVNERDDNGEITTEQRLQSDEIMHIDSSDRDNSESRILESIHIHEKERDVNGKGTVRQWDQREQGTQTEYKVTTLRKGGKIERYATSFEHTLNSLPEEDICGENETGQLVLQHPGSPKNKKRHKKRHEKKNRPK